MEIVSYSFFATSEKLRCFLGIHTFNKNIQEEMMWQNMLLPLDFKECQHCGKRKVVKQGVVGA